MGITCPARLEVPETAFGQVVLDWIVGPVDWVFDWGDPIDSPLLIIEER